jgi:hypothetical protein
LPAFRPGILVAGFARLLRGPGCGAIVATLVAPIHTLRLRRRRRDASEHYDGSQETNASPETHPSFHAVLLWCSESRHSKCKIKTGWIKEQPPALAA